MMTVKEELHRLIEALPDAEAIRVMDLLKTAVRDPLSDMLRSAPEDPEPLTVEEAAAVDRAWEEVRSGQTVSWDKVRKQLG